MPTCRKCSQQNPPDAVFCQNPACGAYLRWDEQHGSATGDQLSVQLGTDALSVVPGGDAGCDVWVRNQGSAPVDVLVTTYGDAQPWSDVHPAALTVADGGQEKVSLRVAPPLDPAPPAGPRRLGVRVEVADDPSIAVADEAVVAVAAVGDLQLTLDPVVSKGYASASHRLTVANTSNRDVSAALAVTSDDEVTVGTAPSEVAAAARGAADAIVEVTLRRTRRFGRRRRHPFRVTASADGVPPAQADGAMVDMPTVPAFLVAVLALLLAGGSGVVAAVAGDDDPSAVCAETALPGGAFDVQTRSGGFAKGGGAGEMRTYAHPDDGFIHLQIVFPDGTGADTAVVDAASTPDPVEPLGGADIDGDGIDEPWLAMGPQSERPRLLPFTFDPGSCSLTRVHRDGNPAELQIGGGFLIFARTGVLCLEGAAGDAHLAVSTSTLGQPPGELLSVDTTFLRLVGSDLGEVPGPPDVAAPVGQFVCAPLQLSAPPPDIVVSPGG